MRNVFLPGSLSELWSVLERNPQSSVYAGGTDLLVKIRSGHAQPQHVICLERLPELKGIHDERETIRIGATTTFAELSRNQAIQVDFPVFLQAIQTLGSPAIRAQGTIGGNICTASPAGDTLPVLSILDADLELLSRNSSRWIPFQEFMIGPGKTIQINHEILASIRIRRPREFNIHHFEKVGKRNALACALASLAVILRISRNGIVEKVKMAWGSVGPTIMRCPEAEDYLLGKELSQKTLAEAAQCVRQAISPIDDVRSTADYRRRVAGNLLFRLLNYSEKTQSN